MDDENLFAEDEGILDLNAVSMDEFSDEMLQLNSIKNDLHEFSLNRNTLQMSGNHTEVHCKAVSVSMTPGPPLIVDELQEPHKSDLSVSPHSMTALSPVGTVSDGSSPLTAQTGSPDCALQCLESTPSKRDASDYAKRIELLKKKFDSTFEAFRSMNSNFAQLVYLKSSERASYVTESLGSPFFGPRAKSPPSQSSSQPASPDAAGAQSKSKRKFETIVSPVAVMRQNSAANFKSPTPTKALLPTAKAARLSPSKAKAPSVVNRSEDAIKKHISRSKSSVGQSVKGKPSVFPHRKPVSAKTSPVRGLGQSPLNSPSARPSNFTGLPTPSASSSSLYNSDSHSSLTLSSRSHSLTKSSEAANSLQQSFGPAAAAATAQKSLLAQSWASSTIRSNLPVVPAGASGLRPPSTRIPKVFFRPPSAHTAN